ncbi:MAG: ABC transporter ATP-binding protein, partial [Acidobacteriota bacterium]
LVRFLNWMIFFDTFQRYLAAQLTERVRTRFDEKFFDKALSVRLELLENASYHDILQRAWRAMDESQLAYQLTQLLRLVSLLFSCLAILQILAKIDWSVPILLLAGSLLVLRWQIIRERELIEINYNQTPLQRRRDYWRDLVIRRNAASEVRLFGLATHIISTWGKLTEQILKEISSVRHSNIIKSLPVKVINIGLFGMVGFSLIFAAASGKIDAGALIAFLYALQDYLNKIAMISWRLERSQRFFSQIGYAQQFFGLQGEEAKTGMAAPETLHKSIHFQAVNFSYPGSDRLAVAGIDLQICPGERIALVGENGAGKSTIAKLLLGLYQPSKGTITIDGIDLQTISPQAWRAKTGAVLQDFMRYAFTAYENIGLGCLTKLNDTTAIEAAADMSSAAQFICQLPKLYDTPLGKEFENGQDLSLGEWQKLAIARVYLRNPDIIVLDEPASALDAMAELEIYRQFLQLSQGKTVLFISHRLGSARMADRILFLQQGRIVQQGTHEELITSSGPYAELYNSQASWYKE